MSLLDVRVYYEDTDHGGVVYHANYLKFMERGRTEFLRGRGLAQSALAKQDDVLFALTRSDLQYRRPAVFDDLLCVHTELVVIKGARIHFKQQIYRQEAEQDAVLLVEADIFLACMSRSGRAKRIPQHILTLISKEIL